MGLEHSLVEHHEEGELEARNKQRPAKKDLWPDGVPLTARRILKKIRISKPSGLRK